MDKQRMSKVSTRDLKGLTFRIEPLSVSEGVWQVCADRDGELVSVRKMTTAELAQLIAS